MSKDKNNRNLPDKDYFRNYKEKKNGKKIRTELSEEEKKEFVSAFGDEENTAPVKIHRSEEKTAHPAPSQEAPAASSENMYKLPSFDSDEFFSGLGVKSTATPSTEKEAVSDPQNQTIAFSKEEFVQVYKEPEEKKRETKHSISDTLTNTIHFNLRSKTRKLPPLDKSKKSFMQNFRVLSKDKQDRPIYEYAPVGKAGKGLADSLKTKKGEDIFEAVEKAYLNKDSIAQTKASDNSSLRAQRNLKGIEKGDQIKEELNKQMKKEKAVMLIYGILFALSLIMTVFFSSAAFYGKFSLCVSFVLFVLSFSAFKNSFKAIRTLEAVPETALCVMSFFVLLHNIIMLALGITGATYTICVIFACFMQSFSAFFKARNRLRSISMAVKSKSLSILQRIPVKNEAGTLSEGSDTEDNEPDIFYCAEAFLDTGVEEPVFDSTRENKYYVFSMSIVLLASLVIGLLCFVAQLTGMSFISALTATVCALLPVMYDPMSRLVHFNKGKELLKLGACISGREALRHIGSSDGFILDTKDVFVGEVSRFRKSAISNISQNDSAVFAALLLKEANSVLSPCFDEFLEQMKITLPEVENFQYEERLGYSAWVLDRKILVGNRQMLVNHSITVPSKEHEKAYGKGRFVMYVVIDGEITATFLANYKVLSSLKKYSRDFNKTGLVLMLSSKEAFLNEEIVAGKLSLDISSVKVLSSKATAVMEKYNSNLENQTPTGLLCSRKKRSIMHLIMGCYNLNACDKLILSILFIGQLLGIILLIASPILKMPVFLNPVVIVLLRLIWCGIINFVIERKS